MIELTLKEKQAIIFSLQDAIEKCFIFDDEKGAKEHLAILKKLMLKDSYMIYIETEWSSLN